MNVRHFSRIVVALGLACAALPTLAVAAEISDPELSAQMDVLQLQRETVNVEHNRMDDACYRRFLVNARRADVARSRRTALGAIAKQELVLSQQQRALLEQDAVRADQLRRETAAQQELERQARLASVIAQQVVPTVIVTHVRHHAQVQIVHHVPTETDQSVVMIVVHQVIAQQVVRMVIAIHAQVPVHLPIVVTDQQVVHTVTEIPVRHRVHLLIGENVVTAHVIHDHLQIVPIVRHVLMVIDQNAVMIVVQVPIAHAEKIHTVAIAHAQAMIAMPVHLRVTANAEADQIVPAVVSPMIAKSVHAVALAKSA